MSKEISKAGEDPLAFTRSQLTEAKKQARVIAVPAKMVADLLGRWANKLAGFDNGNITTDRTGQRWVSSRIVATQLGKSHSNLLRKIDSLPIKINFASAGYARFKEASYVDDRKTNRREVLLEETLAMVLITIIDPNTLPKLISFIDGSAGHTHAATPSSTALVSIPTTISDLYAQRDKIDRTIRYAIEQTHHENAALRSQIGAMQSDQEILRTLQASDTGARLVSDTARVLDIGQNDLIRYLIGIRWFARKSKSAELIVARQGERSGFVISIATGEYRDPEGALRCGYQAKITDEGFLELQRRIKSSAVSAWLEQNPKA